ncbi:hypothetical protein GCK32_007481 [Trichostrongylus colubriformis]|uniref:Uncharacterized protein n=1 Tax=Trichostrongylus colubriformis TaxID=6319 RepID=A0AAN8FP99_TRICO
MASTQPTDEFTRKRQTQERRLIEEICYKRSCVRLAPSFPSEEEIQKKIRKFMRYIYSIVTSNSLFNGLAEVSATKSKLFARAEAALYKCRLEKVHMEVSNTMDRIRGAAEGLSMAYEVYGLLVLSDKALETSRDAFYDEEEQGVSLEPSFIADFVRKELDFLEELNHRIESEIREAQLQEQNESRVSEFEKVKNMISELREDFSKEWEQIRGQIDSQNDSMKSMKESIEAMGESLRNMSEAPARVPDIKPDSPRETSMEEDQGGAEDTDDQVEEDLLDFGEEYDYCDSISEVNGKCASADKVEHEQFSYPEKQRKMELGRRRCLIRAFLAGKSDVPERRISYLNSMRPEDTFLVCLFCLAKRHITRTAKICERPVEDEKNPMYSLSRQPS